MYFSFHLFIGLLIYYLSLFSMTCQRQGQLLVWLEVGLLIIIIIIINFSSNNSRISSNSTESSPTSVSLVELFSD